MEIKDFDFSLPKHLIAQEPVKKRDESRLLILRRQEGLEHRRFYNITDYLQRGDMLLLNDTKVLPLRLTLIKPTGGRLKILLIKSLSENRWEVLCSKRYTGKVTLHCNTDIEAEIEDGRYLIYSGSKEELLSVGEMPLPPYIRRLPNDMDKGWYQTVYAKVSGSIASPTAGLHFTEGLLREIKEAGVLVRFLTLHVGIGTFKPVRTDGVEKHLMEHEYFELPVQLIKEINNIKSSLNRLIAVGTTTVRAIEGFMRGRFRGGSSNGLIKGSTDIFIYPGYQFKVVDALITNFHLPRSTPLLLTSAFAGRERLLSAYKVAVKMGYRFFSYGDAMLIL